MYTRCSHCQAQTTISVEQLRRSRGLMNCPDCGQRFDALSSLNDEADAEFQTDDKVPGLPELIGVKPVTSRWWGVATAFAVLGLLGQILYFRGDELIQQPQLRAGLLAVCESLGCSMPAYKNLDAWSVSHSDMQAVSDHYYVYTAAITNQALFPQFCPDLKLVLLNFNGQPIAERIFSGRQYSITAMLAANDTAQISLTIVAPVQADKMGGYTFALL